MQSKANYRLFKIGCTKNFDQRKKTINNISANGIELIYLIEVEDMFKEESFLKDFFKRFNTNGEWFDLLSVTKNIISFKSLETIGAIYKNKIIIGKENYFKYKKIIEKYGIQIKVKTWKVNIMSIVTKNSNNFNNGSNNNYFKFNCDPSIDILDFVYIDSNLNIVKKAIATSFDTSIVIGIVYKKITSTECIVQLSGKIKIVGLVSGKIYYLSSIIPGKISLNFPTQGIIKRVGRTLINDYFIIEPSTFEAIKN